MRVKIFLYFSSAAVFLISCGDPLKFSYSAPKTPASNLSSIQACDYKAQDGGCFFYKEAEYKIGDLGYMELEILFVLDVSLSMEDSLQKIGTAFSSLMEEIKLFDWKMAFTTADHGSHFYYVNKNTGEIVFPAENFNSSSKRAGRLSAFGQFMPLQRGEEILSQKILNSSYADFEQIFYDTITSDYLDSDRKTKNCFMPPFCQEGHEQPLKVLSSVLAKKDLSPYNEFFTPEGVFVAFVLTDEPERAADPEPAPAKETADKVLQSFKKAFPNGSKKFLVYDISIQNENCLKKQQRKGNAGFSKELNQLSARQGGFSVNICDENYLSSFSRVSKDLKTHTREIFIDSNLFISQSTPLKVSVKNSLGESIKIDWTVDHEKNTISFYRPLPAGSKIHVMYYAE